MIDKKQTLKATLSELSNFPVFQGLKTSEVEALCEGGHVVVTPHHHYLFQHGHDAHFFGFVLSGAYKLLKPSPQGEDTIIYFSTPGDIIGVLVMAQPGSQYPLSSIAMGPSRFLKIPRETYLKNWVQFPDVILKTQSLLSSRIRQLHNQKVMSKANLHSKLAFVLIEILKKAQDKDDLTLPLPITRKELADNLGTSVESVIRIMSEWSKEGVLETKDQHIKILDLKRVMQIASS